MPIIQSPGSQTIHAVQAAVSNKLCSDHSWHLVYLETSLLLIYMEETLYHKLSKYLFTAIGFSFLAHILALVSSLNFCGFIYSLISTFTIYFFGDYWKSQTRPHCVLSVNQGRKKELGVCQELLWSVSLQPGKVMFPWLLFCHYSTL